MAQRRPKLRIKEFLRHTLKPLLKGRGYRMSGGVVFVPKSRSLHTCKKQSVTALFHRSHSHSPSHKATRPCVYGRVGSLFYGFCIRLFRILILTLSLICLSAFRIYFAPIICRKACFCLNPMQIIAFTLHRLTFCVTFRGLI